MLVFLHQDYWIQFSDDANITNLKNLVVAIIIIIVSIIIYFLSARLIFDCLQYLRGENFIIQIQIHNRVKSLFFHVKFLNIQFLNTKVVSDFVVNFYEQGEHCLQ
eukprot:TRINITY_DN2712_c0_g2_i2.p3 TRINITY_DN2712_c0_g2~~TRINITY_DN2712_c0_g2_i2.p3  ORF type:complete len:105 (-),score=1.00 TRINITY_DN2712_c0_g2_i2:269-583(-)